MSRIESYRKIRAAAFFVSRIYSGIQTLFIIRTDCGHKMAACRKAKHSDFMWINMPLVGVQARQAQHPLRIFQRDRRVRIRP